MQADMNGVDVALQLAPAARASADMKAFVSDAFVRAGLTRTRWLALPGDRSRVGSGPPAAAASLVVRLRADAPGATERTVATVRESVARALAEVRARRPEIPIGIEIEGLTGRQRFSFAPDDTSDDVLAGLGAFAEAVALEAPVVGWSRDQSTWMLL